MDRPGMTTRRRARHSRFIFVGADKVGMNSLRLLDLGLLVLGLLGLLPLLLCGLLGGVVVVGTLLCPHEQDELWWIAQWFMSVRKNLNSLCLSSAKFRSTDSVNPRAVLSRVRPRYRHLL
jgi:hypothetical protein